MGIFERFLKREKTVTKSQMIEESASFSVFSGDAYSNDIFREGIDAIARNAGKLKGSHVIAYKDQERENGDVRINRLLQVRPNKFMSAYDFIYKVVTRLYLYNNSFAYIERDNRGDVVGLYPITASHVDILGDQAGNLYCGFFLKSGRYVTLPYDDIIHLRRFFNDDEILGSDNYAIHPGLELAQTQNEGLVNGIKSSASIRGILRFTQIMSPSKLKDEKDAFLRDYLSMGNDGGVVAVDQKMDYQPIESKPIVLDANQQNVIRDKIFSYLGVTEAIVSSSYTEDQFSAFYESTIEPIATALSQEMTAKLFTEREQAFGNEIVFESGRLQFTSNATKVNLISQLMPLGLLTVNQALEILNLPGVVDGDKRLQALNMISADQAEKYQGEAKK